MKKKITAYKVFKLANAFIMILVTALCLYPFIYTFSISVSSKTAILNGDIVLFPRGFNLKAYREVFNYPGIFRSYLNTIIYTVSGTAIGLFMTTIAAYPLSKNKLKGRNIVLKFIVFTMFLNGGLIPGYILLKNIGFLNHIWALIIPGSINVYFMILMITFFKSIPESLEEAAEIDGLNPIQILAWIVLPLSKPIIATVGLFYAVWFWNDWFCSMIYFNDSSKYPVMLILQNIISGSEAIQSQNNIISAKDMLSLADSFKAAAIFIVIIPILSVYPFIQKYFTKGVMIGSIKG